MAAPDIRSDRIIELDAMRGLAVIGIVWMNVYVFAMPSQAYYNPVVWSPTGDESSQLDRIVWAASFVFIEDKFRTLFAMLFGAGCLIVLERNAVHPWRGHFARMLILMLIGLAHSVLFASNDVLRVYALAGCAMPFLAHLSHRSLFAVSIGLVAVHCGGGIVVFGSAVLDLFTGRGSGDATLFAERNFGSDPAALRYSLELGREAWGERITRRLDGIPDQLRTLIGAIPLNLAAMTLGMALWKDRMLAGQWRTFRLQRVAAICAIISIPSLLGMAWWVGGNGFPGAIVGSVALIASAPFDMLLGIAYAALAMAFFNPGGSITRALAAAGRLSLTNYIMTSLILAAIFASWGLGLFGEVTRPQAFALSFIPILAMLSWSRPWLAYFGQGPLERLWRGLSAILS